MSAVPDILLNNGQSIPQFGFGVFLIKPEDTAEAVGTALQAGYRHVDTAEMYGNEREVGEAIRKSGLDRADVFVTSKLGNGAVNQIEVHPYFTQDDVRAFCAEHQIAIEAWSPIARGRVLDDPTIKDVVDRTGRTAAQVVLRWHIQLGNIVFPKSVRLDRIEENFNIFDFELSSEDMAAISKLDRGERTGPDPDTFNYVPD
ncbi:MAG TPA: oxidoreductase [Actinobacteria bacterium]|nr:oxidoreductase [Actinomycetota bacterium]